MQVANRLGESINALKAGSGVNRAHALSCDLVGLVSILTQHWHAGLNSSVLFVGTSALWSYPVRSEDKARAKPITIVWLVTIMGQSDRHGKLGITYSPASIYRRQ